MRNFLTLAIIFVYFLAVAEKEEKEALNFFKNTKQIKILVLKYPDFQQFRYSKDYKKSSKELKISKFTSKSFVLDKTNISRLKNIFSDEENLICDSSDEIGLYLYALEFLSNTGDKLLIIPNLLSSDGVISSPRLKERLTFSQKGLSKLVFFFHVLMSDVK